jgi:hypothetical protein
MALRLLAVFAALLTVLAACSSDDPEAATSEDPSSTPQILANENEGDPENEGAAEAEATPTPAPQGVVVNPYELVTGDCFNDYILMDANEVRQDVTTALGCDLAHDGEVYFHLFFPGTAQTAFPGDSKLGEWAQEQCFAQFEAFVGQAYELSELDIGIIQPTLETWIGPGLHRQVTCYVKAWRGGQLQGSMSGTGY